MEPAGLQAGHLSGWLRWKVVYAELQRAWEVWCPWQLWPRLNPAALCLLAARAAREGSSVRGREQGGEVEERHCARPVFVKPVGYSWISNRADEGCGERENRGNGEWAPALCLRVPKGEQLALTCFVLGGSSLLQGRAADVARKARLASCETQQKKVGCSGRPHPRPKP